MLIGGTGITAHSLAPWLAPIAPREELRNSGPGFGSGCFKKKKKKRATFLISFFLARKIAHEGMKEALARPGKDSSSLLIR